MIVLVDLDGTLVDRAAAFTRWARAFVAGAGGSDDDTRWLLDLDADGYTPRADVAVALRRRLGLDDDVPRLVDRLLFEHVDAVRPYPGVVEALGPLREGGAAVVVVTNGTVVQQQRKLEVSGLLELVDDVVVSEAVGAKKPDAAVFRVALERARRAGGTGRAWMVGDHPDADVGGGRASGLLTGWVSHGRTWPGGPPPRPQRPGDRAAPQHPQVRAWGVTPGMHNGPARSGCAIGAGPTAGRCADQAAPLRGHPDRSSGCRAQPMVLSC